MQVVISSLAHRATEGNNQFAIILLELRSQAFLLIDKMAGKYLEEESTQTHLINGIIQIMYKDISR